MEDTKNPKVRKPSPREMINEKSERRRQEKRTSDTQYELLVSYEEISKSFFEPYSIPALGGREGLTATDIAHLLDVKVSHVLQKVKTEAMQKMFKYLKSLKAEFSALTATGVHYNDFAFDTKTAEMIIAKYNNPIGWMYLRFLQASKNFVPHALKDLEKNQEEIKRLKKENEELRKTVGKKSDPYDPICNLVTGMTHKDSFLNGESKVAETVQKRKSDFTESELILHDIQLSIRRGLGYFNRAFKNFLKINIKCKNEGKGFEKCLKAAKELDELINRTSLDREVVHRSVNPKKGAYVQPSLLDDETMQTQYLN